MVYCDIRRKVFCVPGNCLVACLVSSILAIQDSVGSQQESPQEATAQQPYSISL
jgi:hypothetical protein